MAQNKTVDASAFVQGAAAMAMPSIWVPIGVMGTGVEYRIDMTSIPGTSPVACCLTEWMITPAHLSEVRQYS